VTAVDQVHALWAAYATGGALATLEHVDDDCEWIMSREFPEARGVRGAAEMREYLERLTRDGIRFEPSLHTCEQVGEHAVLVGGRMRIVSRAALSDSPLFWVYRTRDERVIRIESYPSRREALDAVGRLAAA
jgi:ketosteroid isomerase-like protein